MLFLIEIAIVKLTSINRANIQNSSPACRQRQVQNSSLVFHE